jgi:hydroxymethylbilane synthase
LRSDDVEIATLIAPLHHAASACCVRAERALGRRLQGGCQVPIGAYAIADPKVPGLLWMRGLVGSPDGSKMLFAEGRDTAENADELGEQLADALLAQGAEEILAAVYAR